MTTAKSTSQSNAPPRLASAMPARNISRGGAQRMASNHVDSKEDDEQREDLEERGNDGERAADGGL